MSVLRSVKWAREPRYWEGVAAKRATTRDGSLGALSFAGGIKDSAHRVFDALYNPSSELGEKIRARYPRVREQFAPEARVSAS